MKTIDPEPSGARVALRLALTTAALGVLALLGWILGLPLLASFGAGRMPMAPSTAVLFLIFGATVGWRTRTPLSDRAFRISTVSGWLLALVALLLFVLSSLGIRPAIEHFGVNITGTVGGAATGHMSPLTAFCFLLAVVSFLALLSRSATRRWRTILALGSAGVLLGAAFIFLLAYFFGTPLLYGGTFIPPALTTLLAFVTLGLALLVLAGRAGGLRGRAPATGDRTAWHFFLIFLVLAAGIVTAGYSYYRSHEQAYRAEVERQLAAIAELKMGELTQWREDRLSDAAIFFKNASFTALVRRFFEQPADADAQRQLRDWLGKFTTMDDYDQFRLMDAQAVTRLSMPGGLNPASSPTVRAAAEALRLGRITICDFYRHEHNQRVYLSVQIPLLDESNANRPLGVLVLRIDPAKYLYPFIQRWPTPSRSAETLLLRRDGNDILYLNDLRHQTNAALTLRLPLSQTNVPAVKAALGQTGIMPGVDYRGAPVLAIAGAVPDSPWFLIAKLDAAEVYAPLRAQLWQVLAMLGILLFSAGAGVGLVWRQQRIRFYRKEAQLAGVLQINQSLLMQAEKIGRVGGWEFDIDTRQQTWTKTVYDIHELDDTGVPTVDQGINFYTPASRPIIERAVQRAIEQGEPFDVELEIITAKGNLRSVHALGQADLARRKISGFIQDITERTQAEKTLRESEHQYRELFESSSDALLLLNSDTGQIMDANRMASELYGYDRDELLARKNTDLSAEPEETSRRSQEAKSKPGQVINIPLRLHRKKDGTVFPVEITARSIHRAGQSVILIACRDITERKQAEEALRASEYRWKFAIEGSGDGLWDWNVPASTVFFTKRWKEMLGFAEDEIGSGLDEWSKRIHPDDLARVMAGVQAHFAGTTPHYVNEHRVSCKDGSWKWILDRGLVVERDAAGKPLRMIGTHSDITTRKQVEAAREQSRMAALNMMEDATAARDRMEQSLAELRASEEQHRSILQTAMDGFWLVDMQGRLLEVNDAYCRMSGYSAPELLAMRIPDLEADQAAEEVAASIQKVKAEGEARFETRHRRKDGSLFDVALGIQYRPVDEGTFVVFIHDITKRQRAEAEKGKLEGQLRQAQKMEAVGQLAGGVAHDFNNQLQVILGCAEIVLKNLPPEQQDHADLLEIQNAAKRSAELTRQLLTFSRQQAIAPVVLDLNAAVASSLKMLGRLIGENIHLRFVQQPDLGRVFMDSGQVNQILTNLVVNARDAIAGAGNISVEAANGTLQAADCQDKADFVPPGDYVLLTVSDDGAGMPPEVQARIFEPFFTTKGVGKGTGLGLATVYGIVKQNHGAITVHSVPGQGTTFTIYLPRVSAAALTSAAATEEQIPTGTETILLVEDEAPVLNLTQRTLAQLGYKVLTAATSHSALRLCAQSTEPIHLLLTDVIMPGMNGKLLADQIQKLRPGLPVLFMSGYAAEIVEQQGQLPEGLRLLPKPFTTLALAQHVRAALDASPAEAPAAAAGAAQETVLVVDDQPKVRASLVRSLRRLGYHVLEAGSGADALRLAHESPGTIHLLLADLTMPDMDGRELAERLRAARPETRVLMVSGDAPDGQGADGAPGGGLWLAKPFTLKGLAQKVREALDAPPV